MSTTNQLPPLPKPDIAQHTQEVWIDDVRCTRQLGPRYTADQMRAYALQARAILAKQPATPEPVRGVIGMGAHTLAGELAQAVAQDDADPEGHDMSAGLFGPNVSAWLRKVAYCAGKQPALGSGSLKALSLHKF